MVFDLIQQSPEFRRVVYLFGDVSGHSHLFKHDTLTLFYENKDHPEFEAKLKEISKMLDLEHNVSIDMILKVFESSMDKENRKAIRL